MSEWRDRPLGKVDLGSGWVSVHHSYRIGDHGDRVGLIINGTDGDDTDATRTIVLGCTPAEALLLADRITRAANLALEAGEDDPDMEREMARFGAPRD